MPLDIKLSRAAAKYIRSLDKPTRNRIADKLLELAQDPFNIRTSKPLTGTVKRTARVGGYRFLFMIESGSNVLLVSDAGPRGQVYRKA